MFVRVAQRIFVFSMWLWTSCFGGRWSRRRCQFLIHSGVEPRAALFAGDLTNKVTILVGCPIPHFGDAMRKLTLQQPVRHRFRHEADQTYCLSAVGIRCPVCPDCVWVVRYTVDLVGRHVELLFLGRVAHVPACPHATFCLSSVTCDTCVGLSREFLRHISRASQVCKVP